MEERLHNPCAHNFCLGLLVAVEACHGALPPAAYPVLFQGLCGLWARAQCSFRRVADFPQDLRLRFLTGTLSLYFYA
jgi:hypothetical protein